MKKNFFGLTIAASLLPTLIVPGVFASTTPVSPSTNNVVSSSPNAISEKVTPLSKDQFYKRYAEITGKSIEQVKAELKESQIGKMSSYAKVFDQEYSVIYDLGGGIKVQAGVLAQVTQISFGGSSGYMINKIYQDTKFLSPYSGGAFSVVKNYINATSIDAHHLQISFNGYAETTVTNSYSSGLNISGTKLVTLGWNISGSKGSTYYYRKPFNSGKTWTIN